MFIEYNDMKYHIFSKKLISNRGGVGGVSDVYNVSNFLKKKKPNLPTFSKKLENSNLFF